ncbi:MAG TPA: GNAT family N-acetyltransferase [Caulobacteraceae bacterium]|nr:GNAT family N-acetyltransferase [Caulobacteraceae bacterium]
MTLTVRPFRPDEAMLFRTLRLEALQVGAEFYGTDHDDEAAKDDAWFAAQLAHGVVFAAFDGETPIGMAGLRQEAGRRKAHKATLWGMYVSPPARGAGAAPALVEAVLDHARAQGLSQVLLTVMARNARARALYARKGFSDWGCEPAAIRIDEEAFDDIHMIRRL